MEDDLNPKYLFNGIATVLLKQIINGKVDPVELAKEELLNRGLDYSGNWIGFTKVKEFKDINK